MNLTDDGAITYSHFDADFGVNYAVMKKIPVFAVGEKENIYEMTACETACDETGYITLDPLELAMVEENARAKYLTSLQHYQFMILRGFKMSRNGIKKKLKKLVKRNIFRCYEIRKEGGEKSVRYYGLGSLGNRIVKQQKLVISEGNLVEEGVMDDAETVKRMLTANMLILGLLRNGVELEGFTFNETIPPLANKSTIGDSGLRIPGMFWIDKESVFMVEVVRSTPNALLKLEDTLRKYYALVNGSDYLIANTYGHRSMPQLVICAENYEESCAIDIYLRSHGLWREEDTILYTHDLVFMMDTLNVFYELGKDGKAVWYCIPSKYEYTQMLCS